MNQKPLLIDLHFLPNLEYFSMMLLHKHVYLEANESYHKGSYRNKAKIVTANGSQLLSIPLQKGKHQQKGIKEVFIAETDDWRNQHWKSLKTAYQSAPFWEDYAPEILILQRNPASALWEYNLQFLNGIIEILQLEIRLSETLTYHKIDTDKLDLRHMILPKNESYYSGDVRSIQYEQVFYDRLDFMANACILDLLFCKGPESSLILEDMIRLS